MKKAILSAAILASTFALAQEKDSINSRAIDEVILNKIIKKETESTSRMPLKAIEDPQVYSTMDKRVLENQLLFTVDDAMRNITGTQKMWSATNRAGDGGTFINLRGFVASSSMRNGLVAPITTSMDAVNVEKVEILKGPSATLFGTNNTSYGGVVNRVTKKPFDHFAGIIALSGGSYNYYRVHTDINTPITNDKKLLFRLNGAYTNQGTFQINKAKNSYLAFTPSLSYKPTDNLELHLEYEAYETDAFPETGIFFYLPSSTFGTNRMDEIKKHAYDYKQSYIGEGLKTVAKARSLFGQVNYKINEHIKSSTNVSTSYSYSDGFNPYFYMAPKAMITQNPADTEIGLVRADQATIDSKRNIFQIQQNFNFDFKIGEMRNRTVAGFDYMKTKDNQMFVFSNFDWVPFQNYDYSTFNATSMGAIYEQIKQDPNYEENSTYPIIGDLNTYSGYVSNVFTPIKGLNILTALRYESNDYKGGIQGQANAPAYKQAGWSPKLGLVYEMIPDKFSVFGNYQNSFKRLGYFTNNTAGDLTLAKPEKANQIEGGFKTNLINGRVNATLSYYNIKVKNTLYLSGYIPGTNTSVQDQSGKLESQGAELEVNAYLIKGFSVIAGISYNDMKYTKADADVLGRRPSTASSPWLVNFNASYQFLDGKLKGLGFGVGGNYASDNKIVNSESMGTFILPKYFVMNANAFYDTQKFRIGVKVDNFTNQEYWLGYTTANAQPLLNVMGNFTFKF